jgi:ribosomal protein S18 acetylase RimI-like enzyme
MLNTTYSTIKNAEEIEILRGKSSFDYTYDQETIDLLKKNFRFNDSFYVLAKNSEEFAGFCSIDRDWWEENFFFLREILVNPNFQKQGIGEKLMSMCLDHAKKNQATGVVTETAFNNLPMQKLCEKLGFKKWNNPKWQNGVTYKKML